MIGKLLGVDYGKVRVGLAISDLDRKFAFPLTTYTRRSNDLDADYFRKLVLDEAIVGLVVGLPIHLDGRESESAIAARKYGDWLAQATGLPVVCFDERFSTTQAESALWQAGLTHKKRKERRDRVAASIFLQAYLDSGCPAVPMAGSLDAPQEGPVEETTP